MRGDGLIDKGSGLGLYCARKAARLQGGDVALVSSSPNQGSVFKISLPFATTGEVILEIETNLHNIPGQFCDGDWRSSPYWYRGAAVFPFYAASKSSHFVLPRWPWHPLCHRAGRK